MVYPHSNDIGKEKPEPKTTISMVDELLKYTYYNPPVYSPPAYKALQEMEALEWKDFQKKMQSKVLGDFKFFTDAHPSYHVMVEAEPILVDGPKGTYSFMPDNSKHPTPVTMTVKQMSIRFRIEGIKELEQQQFNNNWVFPDKEMTESEVRSMLQMQFKKAEDYIIEKLKKAKGIK